MSLEIAGAVHNSVLAPGGGLPPAAKTVPAQPQPLQEHQQKAASTGAENVQEERLSREGQRLVRMSEGPREELTEGQKNPQRLKNGKSGSMSQGVEASAGSFELENDLSPEDIKRLQVLKQIDRRTRAHEKAHMAAGGGIVMGGPTYKYEIGPDGKQYAFQGDVKIDVSPGPNPRATLRKAMQIQRAALAPADPSAQDRRVAAEAQRMAEDARGQLRQEDAMKNAQLRGEVNDAAFVTMKMLSFVNGATSSLYSASNLTMKVMGIVDVSA